MGNYASNNQSAHGNKQVTNKSTKVCTLYILFKSLLTFFFFFVTMIDIHVYVSSLTESVLNIINLRNLYNM
jgi:hypothetical protein